MAKQNIISDFSALKGKISFSEKKIETKPTPDKAESNLKHEGLKAGQSIVMMDSNLRGKIVQIGKKVRIELEEGLTIEAAYGEFAVTDSAEISSLKESRVKRKREEKPNIRTSSTSSGGNITIDLHIEALPGGRGIPEGQQLQFQMETFRRIIRENLSHKGMTLTFVHGIGDGILKSSIRKELDDIFALRCSYSVGDPAITIVSIR